MHDPLNPLIFVEGRPGTGKSSAIESLDPSSTSVANTDNKPLPFRKKFPHTIRVKTPSELLQFITEFQKDDSKKVAVIDTLSGWLDLLLNASRTQKKGFDIWNTYNTSLGLLFQKLMACNKVIFVLSHTELVETAEGETIISAKVKGKEWEGYLESKALVVLTTKVIHDPEERDPLKQNKYYFETQTDGKRSSKSPRGMFDKFLIPNDFQYVYNKLVEYYGDELNPSPEIVEKAEEHFEEQKEPLPEVKPFVNEELPKVDEDKNPETEDSVIEEGAKYDAMSVAQKRFYLTNANAAVEKSQTIPELTKVWNDYTDIQHLEDFKSKVKNRRLFIEGETQKKVVDLTDKEAETILNGKIVEGQKEEMPYGVSSDLPLNIREILISKYEDIDSSSFITPEARDFFGDLMFHDIDALYSDNSVPLEEINKLFQYLKGKWDLHSDGKPWPFKSNFNSDRSNTTENKQPRIIKIRA